MLTAFGLIISTIIISLTGGAGAAGGSPNPPKHPNRLKEGLKNKLKALARLLGRNAGKAAAALPGIIGSIIAVVFSFLKKVVTTAAGHVWIFLSLLVTLIGYTVYQHINSPNHKRKRLLGRNAGKEAAALAGIMGSIIAVVLNFLKKVVTAAVDHV